MSASGGEEGGGGGGGGGGGRVWNRPCGVGGVYVHNWTCYLPATIGQGTVNEVLPAVCTQGRCNGAGGRGHASWGSAVVPLATAIHNFRYIEYCT